MSHQNTEQTDLESPYEPDETDHRSSDRDSAIAEYARNGTLATVAGGVLLADAIRTVRRNRRRAGLETVAGATLVAVGRRQRHSSGDSSTSDDDSGEYAETESIGSGDDTDERSDEARAHRERSDMLHDSETNPRGVAGEPDVETATDPDDGEIRFTTERTEDASPKPHLEEPTEDPRRSETDPETGDDHVAVDLSEAAMADEASEATGPDPEQAYPALEGTDPEPMSEEAPPRQDPGPATNAGSDDENRDADDESAEPTEI